ncbi:MAG TPA: MFS transporter [Candidatus Limnocylindrales bacterium]
MLRSAFGPTLGPLREGPYLRYFIAVTISAAGSFASTIALAFGVLDAAGPAQLALIFLAREVPLVALVLAGGVFADRFPRHIVLAGSNAAQAATQLAGAAVLIVGQASGHTSTELLALLAVLNGVAGAFARPAVAGFVPELVSRPNLQAANALLGMTRNIVGIAGSVLGAGLITAIGAGWALAFDSATFVVAAILVLTIGRGVTRAKRTESPLADLVEGFRAVKSRRWLWVTIASFGFFQMAYFPAVLVLGPQVAREHLGGPAGWAAILSLQLVGGLVGGVMATHLQATRPLVVIYIVVIPTALMLAALTLALPLPVVAAISALNGVGFALSDAVWFTTLQRNIPADALSRVSSFDWLGSIALNPLGYAIIAPLSLAIGEQATLAAATVLLGLAITLPLALSDVRALRMAAFDAHEGLPMASEPSSGS